MSRKIPVLVDGSTANRNDTCLAYDNKGGLDEWWNIHKVQKVQVLLLTFLLTLKLVGKVCCPQMENTKELDCILHK